MIPDWKLERYLTGDLPASEMRELREMEASDEMFACRVRMMREDNLAILRKMPFDSIEAKLDARGTGADGVNGANVANVAARKNAPNFRLVKFAAAAVFALAFVVMFAMRAQDLADEVIYDESASVDIMAETETGARADRQVAMAEMETGTRIKGLDARMEVWKKTEKGIVQMENLGVAHEGDEIQLRYSVPQKCFGLLFSMDGNGTLTMHMGDENKSVALEPGKMVTLPFAYKLDDAPKFEKFFLLTSRNEFELDAANIDAVLKKDGVESRTLTLRKVEGGR